MDHKNQYQSQYRPDIDGLRAIAVAIVILYHAHVKGFTGGFVGVDIFFVISGFLISSILLRGFQKDTFSALTFFSRRIRRIIPALTVVILFVSIAGFYLLPPNEYMSLGKATKYLGVLLSNHFFLHSKNDYWQQNTLGAQPLLHTWSIAIEEQFYILFPLLLGALFWIYKGKNKTDAIKALFVTFTLLFLVSFGVNALFMELNPPTSFYILPARMWELFLGTVLSAALILKPITLKKTTLEVISAVGITLILWCTFSYGHETAFPGWNALWPCLGSGLVILSGSFGEKTILNRLLSFKPLVFIGLISYSLYLWHWPIFVFAQSPYWQFWKIKTPPVYLLLFATFVLSYLSWKFIESPFRVKKNSHPLWVTAAGLILLLGFVGLGKFEESIGGGHGPIVQNIPESLKVAVESAKDTFEKWQFSNDPEEILKKGGRLVGESSVAPSFVVLGDSMASMWGPALDSLARDKKRSGLLMAREWCASLDGLARKTEESCYTINQARLDYVEKSAIKDVVLAMDWKDIVRTDTDPGYYLKNNPLEENLRYVTLERTLERLTLARKRIYIVLQTPGGSEPLADVIASVQAKNGISYRYSYREVMENPGIIQAMRDFDLLKRKFSVTFFDPVPLLCNLNGCIVAKGGKPLYIDNTHLSSYGGEFLVNIFEPLFSH